MSASNGIRNCKKDFRPVFVEVSLNIFMQTFDFSFLSLNSSFPMFFSFKCNFSSFFLAEIQIDLRLPTASLGRFAWPPVKLLCSQDHCFLKLVVLKQLNFGKVVHLMFKYIFSLFFSLFSVILSRFSRGVFRVEFLNGV